MSSYAPGDTAHATEYRVIIQERLVIKKKMYYYRRRRRLRVFQRSINYWQCGSLLSCKKYHSDNGTSRCT